MPTCEGCGNQFPNRKKIEGKTRVLKSRKYCLDCSPWTGQHNNQPLERRGTGRRCCLCGETDEAKFYGNKRRICGTCHNQQNLGAQRTKRQRAIDYLGGKCLICDYDRFKCALDIHHLDRSKKDPNANGLRCWSWERIKKELEFCCLLCKCCHAAVHQNEIPSEDVERAEKLRRTSGCGPVG